MTVTVTPETFNLVTYDSGEIASIVGELMSAIGLPSDLNMSDTVPL